MIIEAQILLTLIVDLDKADDLEVKTVDGARSMLQEVINDMDFKDEEYSGVIDGRVVIASITEIPRGAAA